MFRGPFVLGLVVGLGPGVYLTGILEGVGPVFCLISAYSKRTCRLQGLTAVSCIPACSAHVLHRLKVLCDS